MSDELILGIDGGGTKTLVTLMDRGGRVLATELGGGVNSMDNPEWRAELEQCTVPFRGRQLAAVAAGLPVYGEVTHLSLLLEQAIAQIFPGVPAAILNDVEAAHLGAFADGAGVLVLSGTGSMAWARDTEGRSVRTGGWGDVIGDEGSSYWIGRLALQLVSQSLDGRSEPTNLAQAVFDHLDLDLSDAMNALGDWATSLSKPRPSIAALSAVVDQSARNGDNVALGLLERAADELAKHHKAIAGHCGPGADWTYAGGTFASHFLLEALERRIGSAAITPRLPPIGGALLAAAKLLDWSVDDRWVENVAISLREAIPQSRNPKHQ
ncbi:N-acetylglucosamine kinase [Rhizobium sp. Root708]|uniref:N-acetylglucosamine kinase n=1 Tax=Rhizobium sp. Root708 TaxID=1736592 RepID=UPI0006F92E2C|nr:BadF/BadG/BcrA/BcrD ATPase family protein [Rhizobium sp. Root708]KRB55030.1 N-acetylglucosamine kinase [Rhizobium sp. Root708]